jgi:hypothetical protein
MIAVGGLIGGRQWDSVPPTFCCCILFADIPTGNLLLKRLLLAITQAKQSKDNFVKFDASLREDNLAEIIEMEKDLAAWEEDKSCCDPYRLPKSSE